MSHYTEYNQFFKEADKLDKMLEAGRITEEEHEEMMNDIAAEFRKYELENNI